MTRTEMILLLMSDEQHGVREAIALTAAPPNADTTPDALFRLAISKNPLRDPRRTREDVELS